MINTIMLNLLTVCAALAAVALIRHQGGLRSLGNQLGLLDDAPYWLRWIYDPDATRDDDGPGLNGGNPNP